MYELRTKDQNLNIVKFDNFSFDMLNCTCFKDGSDFRDNVV